MNKVDLKHLASYGEDFALWAAEQGALLRAGKLDRVDLENVAEEIESLGRSDRYQITSRMEVLLTHLLKWEFQPEGRTNSWKATIVEQRMRIANLLDDSPSLRPFPLEALRGAYVMGLNTGHYRNAPAGSGISLKVPLFNRAGPRRRLLARARAGMMRFFLAALLLSLASPAHADVSAGVALNISGDAEVKAVKYTCDGHDPIVVRYVNAAPNFLALVPVDDQTLVFATIIAGSGTKYVSGQYEWRTKGNDATLQDVTEGLDAAPVLTCSEEVDTP